MSPSRSESPTAAGTLAASGLPDPVIAALLGVSPEEMWDIRNRGVIPPGALPRIRAFTERGGDVIPGLIRIAERHGRQIRDIRLFPPSLETLFISLTGRTIE